MNLSPGNLVAGVVFGIFGLYIYRQSRRDVNLKRTILAVTLFIYPFFIEKEWVTWIIGTVLVIVNYSRWMD